MATALIRRQNTQIISAGKFGVDLIARFVKFAGVSSSSQKTYKKCLDQMDAYLAANAISNPTRENLFDWVEELKASGKSASSIRT